MRRASVSRAFCSDGSTFASAREADGAVAATGRGFCDCITVIGAPSI